MLLLPLKERLDERVNEASAASKVARDELHTSLVGHIQTLRTDMNARHDEGTSMDAVSPENCIVDCCNVMRVTRHRCMVGP